MFKTILEIEGKVYSLSSINLSTYNRGSGYDPSPNDQTIQFQIRSTKIDQFMLDWMNGPEVTKKNGKIKLLNTDDNTTLQTIAFENGFISSFNMSFYQNNDYSNETSVTMAASKITMSINTQSTGMPSAKKD